MENGKNQIDIFNFLRVYALLCVIVIHLRIVISKNIPQLSSPGNWSWLFSTPAWIAMGMFIILSGYLLGKGFYNNKYKTDISGILNFYISRLIRIVPMYLFFLLIFFIFINPSFFFQYKGQIVIPLLTFTYNGYNPAIDGIGSLWFVSTIFQLYLIAPFFYKFFIAKTNGKYHIFLIIMLLFMGFYYRIVCQNMNLEWWHYVYTSSFANIDYFFCGMLINSLTKDSLDNIFKRIIRPISIVVLVIFTCHIMLLYHFNNLEFYKYYAPSWTIIIFIIIIWAFDSKDRIKSSKLTFITFINNPFRIIDIIGKLSFGFYLYHSNFLAIMPQMIFFNCKTLFNIPLTNGQIIAYTCIFTFIVLLIWTSILYVLIEKPANKYKTNLNTIDIEGRIRAIKDKILSKCFMKRM